MRIITIWMLGLAALASACSSVNTKPDSDIAVRSKYSIGADAVGPSKSSAAHNRNTEMVYWFACKDPSWPVDSVFVPGQGLRGRCYTVGGN